MGQTRLNNGEMLPWQFGAYAGLDKFENKVLKGLFHPAFLARVVSWFPFVVAIFMGHENGGKQRLAKRRHVQGMLDETDPLKVTSRNEASMVVTVCYSGLLTRRLLLNTINAQFICLILSRDEQTRHPRDIPTEQTHY